MFFTKSKKTLLSASLTALAAVYAHSANAQYDSALTFWSFPSWNIWSDVHSLQNEVAENSANIESNNIMLESLQTQLDDLDTAPANVNSVILSVDCSTNSNALVEAYNANIDAASISVSLSGECYGGFQREEFGFPDLSLFSDQGASLIADPETGKGGLVAMGNILQIDGVDIAGGINDDNVVEIIDNASALIQNASLTGINSLAVVLDSAKAEFVNVELIGGPESSNGIAARRNASVVIENVNVDLENNALNAVAGASFFIAGPFNSSGRLLATQGHFTLNNDATLNLGGVALDNASSLHGFSGSQVVVDGRVTASVNSSIRLRSLEVYGDNVQVERGSVLRVSGSDGLFRLTDGELRVEEAGVVELAEGEIFSVGRAVRLDGNSLLKIDSATLDDPFTIVGDVDIAMSSADFEDTIVEGAIDLKFGSKLITDDEGSLLFGYTIQDSSAVYTN